MAASVTQQRERRSGHAVLSRCSCQHSSVSDSLPSRRHKVRHEQLVDNGSIQLALVVGVVLLAGREAGRGMKGTWHGQQGMAGV